RQMAVASAGNLYLVDSGNYRIRRVDGSGNITTISGNGERGYCGDGNAAHPATFDTPTRVVVNPDGSLLITDTINTRIRQEKRNGSLITLAGANLSEVSTLKPGFLQKYNGDGIPARQANLDNPHGAAMDAQGNVYISDTLDHRIRIIDTKGIINTIAGNGTEGYSGDGGPASRAEIDTPEGITVDPTTGKVFWVETGNNLV